MKLFFKLYLFIGVIVTLYLFSIKTISAATPDPINSTNNEVCHANYYHGQQNANQNCTDASYPNCIENKCYSGKNRVGYGCGEGADCESNDCNDKHICKGVVNDCSTFTTTPSCNAATNCFWYKGGRGGVADDPYPGSCRNRQNVGMACYEGACYADQSCHGNAKKNDNSTVGFCGKNDLAESENCGNESNSNWACSAGLTCKNGSCQIDTAASPDAGTKPNCSVLDNNLSSKGNGTRYATCSTECSSGETKNTGYSCPKDTDNAQQFCCEGPKIGSAASGGNADPQSPGIGFCSSYPKNNALKFPTNNAITPVGCTLDNSTDKGPSDFCKKKVNPSATNFYQCPGTTPAPFGPTESRKGFCADGQRGNSKEIHPPAGCTINNATLDETLSADMTSPYCKSLANSNQAPYFYYCGGSSPTPTSAGPLGKGLVTNGPLTCDGTRVVLNVAFTPGANENHHVMVVWADSLSSTPKVTYSDTKYGLSTPEMDGTHSILYDVYSCPGPAGIQPQNPPTNPAPCVPSQKGSYAVTKERIKTQADICASNPAASPGAGSPAAGGAPADYASHGSACNKDRGNMACQSSSDVCSIHWDCTGALASQEHGCCMPGAWCPSTHSCLAYGQSCAACPVAGAAAGAAGEGCAAPNPSAAANGYDCPDIYHSGSCGGSSTCKAFPGSKTGCRCVGPAYTPTPIATTTPIPAATSCTGTGYTCGGQNQPTTSCSGTWNWIDSLDSSCGTESHCWRCQ